jgi:hypothetical protein
MVTLTGLKWLGSIVDSQNGWFEKKTEILLNYIGSTDRSVRFLDPRAWYSELLMATGRWFTASATLLGGYPLALARDIKGIITHPRESLASIVVTPFYVIFGGSFYLVFSILCVGGSIVLTLLGAVSITVLLAYWGLQKLGNCVGTCLGNLAKIANGSLNS